MNDTQDHINEKIVAVSIKTAKLSGKALAQALSFLARKLREEKTPAGKQSIKQLVRQSSLLRTANNTTRNTGGIVKKAVE